MLMSVFAGFFFNLTLFMTKLRVLVLSFHHFMDKSLEISAIEAKENYNISTLFKFEGE